MEFYEKLQILRRESGLSQENLAELLHVSRQAISKWESGRTLPEVEKLLAISERFSVPLDFLLKDSLSLPDKGVGYEPGVPQEAVPPPMQQTAPKQETPECPPAAEPKMDCRYCPRQWRYEYKSARSLFGLPLVHVNLAFGCWRPGLYEKAPRAKGVLAVGNIASGVLAVGLLARGMLSLGGVSAGVLSLGCASVGLLCIGALAAGGVAVGALALGIVAVGAVAIGMFSLGAASLASHLAIGAAAAGRIAIGEMASGAETVTLVSEHNPFAQVSAQTVRHMLTEQFPRLWGFVVDALCALFYG